MNSRRKALDAAHRKATADARLRDCDLCYVTGCEPCHFPTHRGLGGGKAGWEPNEYMFLCRHCHDLIDGRLGVSAEVEFERDIAIRRLEKKREQRWG